MVVKKMLSLGEQKNDSTNLKGMCSIYTLLLEFNSDCEERSEETRYTSSQHLLLQSRDIYSHNSMSATSRFKIIKMKS